jgi:hypothetical protein
MGASYYGNFPEMQEKNVFEVENILHFADKKGKFYQIRQKKERFGAPIKIYITLFYKYFLGVSDEVRKLISLIDNFYMICYAEALGHIVSRGALSPLYAEKSDYPWL